MDCFVAISLQVVATAGLLKCDTCNSDGVFTEGGRGLWQLVQSYVVVG
jgi:hypothetical protein